MLWIRLGASGKDKAVPDRGYGDLAHSGRVQPIGEGVGVLIPPGVVRRGRWHVHIIRRINLIALFAVTACGGETPPATEPPPVSGTLLQLIIAVRQQAISRIPPMPPPLPVRPALVSLGRALAFDRELSGTRSISCMTCHHPAFATGDGRSLSVGHAGSGVGPHRVPDASSARKFIPRNSPALFNLLGQRSFFHDGRVEQVGGVPNIRTPAGPQLTQEMRNVFEFGPLSAVALFPVVDRDEMRGFSGNELAAHSDSDFAGVWSSLMRRFGAIPEYRQMFEAAYPGTSFSQMTFAHASNAIAGFLVSEFTFLRSPWDRFLEGDDRAIGESEVRGAQFFLTQGCANCHLGPALSNFGFHNTVLPQIGPGMGNGPSGRDDFGRQNITGQPIDLYRFRTTGLRNVELTAPYGHAGQFATLEGFVDHYNDVARAFREYDISQVETALRGTLVPNEAQIVPIRDPLVAGIRMSRRDVDDVSAFLRALTDPAARNLGARVPSTVPSGLPVDRP